MRRVPLIVVVSLFVLALLMVMAIVSSAAPALQPPGALPTATSPISATSPPPFSGGSGSTGGSNGTTTTMTSDGRIGPTDVSAPIAVFCTADNGVAVFRIDLRTSAGEEVFQATNGQIALGLDRAKRENRNVLIAQSGDISLWALKSNQLQVNGFDPREGGRDYINTFAADRCGEPILSADALLGTFLTATPVAGATPYGTALPGPQQIIFSGNVYTVQGGDTMLSIAQRFGITVPEIAAANNITDPSRIFVGDRLLIPESGLTTQNNIYATPAAPSTTTGFIHTVVAGENLFRIALRYGVSLDTLARVNNIRDIRLIYVGQQLIIPGR